MFSLVPSEEVMRRHARSMPRGDVLKSLCSNTHVYVLSVMHPIIRTCARALLERSRALVYVSRHTRSHARLGTYADFVSAAVCLPNALCFAACGLLVWWVGMRAQGLVRVCCIYHAKLSLLIHSASIICVAMQRQGCSGAGIGSGCRAMFWFAAFVVHWS